MQSRTNWKAAFAAAALGAALGWSGLAAQDTGAVRGRVVEGATQRPIAGAQVLVDGTGRGGLTNAEGAFLVMNVPSGPQTVSVQMIGYATIRSTVDVSPGGTTDVNFELTQTAIQLDGLVVTGTPGAVQKRAVGNTVSSIEAARISEVTPVTNLTQLLQGRTPGLTVMNPSGQVGVAANWRIRGAGSLNAGNQPVFYVDGVKISAGAQGGFGTDNNTARMTSALDLINPDDIESIEVIKGPAAATLYGADAAAGVIQIITKKGRVGAQSVELAGRVDVGRSDWAVDMPTNYTLCTEARINNPASWPGCAGMDPSAPWQERLLTEQPLRDALREGETLRYSLSARGGTDRFSFYVSGDTEEDEGVFTNNYFERTTGRANFTVVPHDDLDLRFAFQYAKTNTRMPLNDNASYGWLRNAYRGRPGASAPWAPGWLGLGPEQISMYDNRIQNERFIFGATADYKPFAWFRNRLTVGLDAGERVNTLFYPIDRTGRAPFGTSYIDGYISHFEPATRDYTVDYSGTIDSGLPGLGDDVTSSFSFGMQYSREDYRRTQVVGEGLLADKVRLISNAATTRSYESREEERSLGYFVQEQIGWRNRMFLTAGVRMDDHSAFGANFSRIFYPKVAGSWVISEEPFFDFDLVDNLRLRAAYGQAGNAPAPFAADRTWTTESVLLENGEVTTALTPGAYGNDDLHAERGQEIEVGFDASLLNDAVGLEFTYYNNRTKDALVAVPVAPSTGFNGTRLMNVGEIANTGTELSIFGSPVRTPAVTWDTRVGVATNSNELVSLGATRDYIPLGYRSVQRHVEGYPLAGYWAEEVLRNADGSLMLDEAGRPVLSEEMSYIGPSAPTREASWTNTLTLFRNVQLYTYMDYKGGHYLFNMRRQTAIWDRNAPEANDPTLPAEEFEILDNGGNRAFVEKADFIKLREVSVRYTLPSEWTRPFRASSMAFTLAGRNLGLWTRYSGSDPEVNIGGSDTFTRSDYMSVPMIRQFVLSLDVRF